MRIFLLALLALFVMALPVMADPVTVNVDVQDLTSFTFAPGPFNVTINDPDASYALHDYANDGYQTFDFTTNNPGWEVTGSVSGGNGLTLELFDGSNYLTITNAMFNGTTGGEDLVPTDYIYAVSGFNWNTEPGSYDFTVTWTYSVGI